MPRTVTPGADGRRNRDRRRPPAHSSAIPRNRDDRRAVPPIRRSPATGVCPVLPRRWEPARIAGLPRLSLAAVHRVLARHRLNRLSWMHRSAARVIRRYERGTPGERTTWTSRSSAASPTAAATRRSAGRRAARPAPTPTPAASTPPVDDRSRRIPAATRRRPYRRPNSLAPAGTSVPRRDSPPQGPRRLRVDGTPRSRLPRLRVDAGPHHIGSESDPVCDAGRPTPSAGAARVCSDDFPLVAFEVPVGSDREGIKSPLVGGAAGGLVALRDRVPQPTSGAPRKSLPAPIGLSDDRMITL